jgi:hypothetical protein
MTREPIAEKDHVHDEWYEVKPETPEELSEFARHLLEDYQHDYGTACHATAALALAGARLVSHMQGLTGFQAGAVMWEFMKQWIPLDGPVRLLDYENLLYPQYEHEFERTITPDTWEWVQGRARELLAEEEGETLISGAVVDHWRSIAAGNVPFGLTVREAA